MREIPKKNYYTLIILILITVLLTLSLASVYKNKEKLVSNFYTYANKITKEEFDEYMLENTDTMIYISDKYDLTHESFEKALKEKLDTLNLKDKLIYIDKSELSTEFIEKLSKDYELNANFDELPLLIIIVDKKVLKTIYVKSNSKVNISIDFEVFE